MRSRGVRVATLMTFAGIAFFASRAGSLSARESALAKTVWDSVYTVAQAGRGESAYAKGCARCHGVALTGGDQATPLAGGAFLANWNGQSLSDLHVRIKSTMPSDSIGIYDAKFVTDVIAFLLKANGFPAGQSELSGETDALKGITIRTSPPSPPGK